MYDKVSELYKDFVEIYCHKYYGLPDDKRKKKQFLNIILKIYFLIDVIIVCGQKMKKNWLIKKNLKIYH